MAADWRCHLEEQGLQEQFVHSRQTKRNTNNHGSAGLQHLHHKLFISKLHLAEQAVFLVGRRPLKTQINSADGPSSPLWKRHYVLDGDAQGSLGWCKMCECFASLLCAGYRGGAGRCCQQAQQSTAFSSLFPQDVTQLYTKKKVSIYLASDSELSYLSVNQKELPWSQWSPTNLKLMRTETRAEFSLCLIFCQLLPSIGAYFSLWGYNHEVDFIHQQCWVLPLSLRAPVWLCSHGPITPAHCTKVLSARRHLEMDALSQGTPGNRHYQLGSI